MGIIFLVTLVQLDISGGYFICGEGGDLITLELTSKVGNEINIGVHFGK